MIFVQRAVNAALVAGGDPIRLTLARTENTVSWFSAPRQRLTGTMRTDSMLRVLGWQPSNDGRTSAFPVTRPTAFLTSPDGTIAMTLERASIRGDGTLVLDIRPMEPVPDSQEFGPVSLVIDGVPGIREFTTTIAASMSARVVVVGRKAQIAVVTLYANDAQVAEWVLDDRVRAVTTSEDFSTDTQTLNSGATLRLIPPRLREAGSVTLSGTVVVDGQEVPLDVTLGQWTRPHRFTPKP
jgi:hypothetical protein